MTGSGLAAIVLADVASAQTALPQIDVNAPKPVAKRAEPPKRPVVRRVAPPVTRVTRPAPAPAPAPPDAATQVANQSATLNQARQILFAPAGARSHNISREAIESLPQGSNQSVTQVLLQAPGVTQDSAVGGTIHVRNEHANVQYRINGIILPEGVSGFGQVLETGFVGNMALITGVLPAQYGYRTSGVIDITTKTGTALQGGSASVYGGSRQTFTPSFEYGGVVGQTEYFVSGRTFTSNEGIENPTASLNPIHDTTHQARAFGYASTIIDPWTRVSVITGAGVNKYEIPNRPGQTPAFTAFGVSNFDSTQLDERQAEYNAYGVAAWQRSINGLDLQVAGFSRYSRVHFVPDPIGDVIFNGVASDVTRQSVLNGVQADGAYRINGSHTLHGGLFVSGESTDVVNTSLLLPLDATGAPVDAPFQTTDAVSKVGWLVGVYLQDEWRLTEQLTLNFGLRFDQMMQFVDANQLSPRVNLVYKPFDGTTIHAGYARYFTPPPQVASGPTNLAAVFNTTNEPATFAACRAALQGGDPTLAVNTASCASAVQASPVQPERSHYFDVGATQRVLPGLELGVDAYYKLASDLIDDGQFGAALVQTAFNYERGQNIGLELSANYTQGNFRAYGNVAFARQTASNIVSNQFLFDPDELAFIASHAVYTDHAQSITGSAGVSYLWAGTRFSADMIYGSGLRSGFANTDHLPAYAQFNTGLSHEFQIPGWKPITARFDVVNVFDTVYELRDGSGIGVFAPQFGPRRGYYVGLSQKL